MAFRLYIFPKIEKKLEKVPQKDREKIIRSLDVIVENPFCGKQLHGKRSEQYSFRVWPYRIIYRVDKKQLFVIVIDFGYRQGIYNG